MSSNCHAGASGAPRHYRLSLAVALALASGAAFATDPAPAAPAPASTPATTDDTNAPKQLGDITVTAEKRTENAQKVPISIVTLDEDRLNNLFASGNDVTILSAQVPSLIAESSDGRVFPRFYIRGLGNTDFDLNTSQPVSMVYDDVVLENPMLKSMPLFDVSQTEVLRGPQGSLFGRNTPAGVVKFDSNKPTDDLQGYFDINYGSFGGYNLQAAISAPITQDWSMRVAILDEHRDNWVTNTDANNPQQKLGGYDEQALRVQLDYHPSDGFNALFNFHEFSDDSSSAALFRGDLMTPGTNNFVPGYDPYQISLDGLSYLSASEYGGSAKLTWDFNKMELVSITAYEHIYAVTRGDVDGLSDYPTTLVAPPGSPQAGQPYYPFYSDTGDSLPAHRQITEEVHLGSKDTDRFEWMVGGYYFNENITINDYNYDCPTAVVFAGTCDYTVQPSMVVQNGFVQQQQLNISYAAFANLGYQLTDDLKIKGGVRYTRDYKYYSVVRPQTPYVLPGTPGYSLPAQYINTDYGRPSWDLSAVYTLNPDVDIYGRVATSFRAPSIQGRLLFQNNPTVAKAETITSFEAGIKTKFWDGRAQANFDIYDFDMHNEQLTVVGGTGNDTELVNARKTIGHGAEFDTRAFLTDQLMVSAAGSYNFTKIKDPNLTLPPCTNGVIFCTPLDPLSSSGDAYIDGNPLPQSPKWIVDVSARYSIPFREGELYAMTDWSYRSKIDFFLYQAVEYTGKPWLQGGARVGYSWDGGKRDLSLFCRNCTNQLRVIGGVDFDDLTGYTNDPRTWGVQFRAEL
jgi:iron complex outermembrane receptor protein